MVSVHRRPTMNSNTNQLLHTPDPGFGDGDMFEA
jgi:hypothetical protein